MGSSGLESGVKISGLKPGIKGGRSLAQMRSGRSSGLSNGIMNHRNMQDPLLLIGAKSPIIYWNAESCTVNASNNVLTVTNLITTSAETLSITSDPNRVSGDVYGGKAGIVFDATDFIVSSVALGNKTESTLIMVAKPDSVSGAYIMNSIWTTFNDTAGDFWITANNGILTCNIIGTPTSNVSTILSYPLKTTDYCIITIKTRITKSGNDAFELFINGSKQSNYTVSTFTPATLFQDTNIRFGGNSSQTLGGNSMSAALVFDYYLEGTEQLRIENYLRWYYGRNF